MSEFIESDETFIGGLEGNKHAYSKIGAGHGPDRGPDDQ